MAVVAINENRRLPLLLLWSLVPLFFIGALSWWWRLLPSSFPSVRLSVRMCQGGYRWADILQILYLILLSESVPKIQIRIQSGKSIGHFTWTAHYVLLLLAILNLHKSALFRCNGVRLLACPSVCLSLSFTAAPTGRIYVKFHIGDFSW